MPTTPRPPPTRRLLLAALLVGAATPGWTAARRVVTILGDSITAGYGLAAADALPARLEAALARIGASARVRGAGVSGDTTAGGLARLDFSVQADTDLCVVALGGNDLLQGLDPATTKANLTRIVRRLKARRIAVVLAGLSAPDAIGRAYARDFDAVFPAVARAEARGALSRPAGRRRPAPQAQSARRHPSQRGGGGDHRRPPGSGGGQGPESPPVIRLFAAIAVPDEIGAGLARRQRGLPGARWRPLASLHITLRFVGDVPENQADDLDAELGRVGGGPVELTLRGVGTFGDGADIHAVWAGVEDNKALRRLAARCETAARRAGLKADTRAWRPHVTLAYLDRGDPASVGAWVQGHSLLQSPAFRVSAFGLYSTWRTADGSDYRLERSYPLA